MQGVLHPAPEARGARGRARAARTAARAARARRRRARRTATSRAANASRCSPISPAPSADATLAVAQGAEGCGLLRTEFLFLERATAPDEDEQLRCYQQVARILGAAPAGDPHARHRRRQTDSLSTDAAGGQSGAGTARRAHQPVAARSCSTCSCARCCAVQPAGQVRILLPMITDVDEIRTVRRMLDEAVPRLGCAAAAARRDDRNSGRGHACRRASRVKSISCPSAPTISPSTRSPWIAAMPSSRRASTACIRRCCGSSTPPAKARPCIGSPVAVCGGLASDPVAVPVLLGLGVSELSVVPTQIPQLKALIRAPDAGCLPRAGAARAHRSRRAAQVRALVREVIR